MKEVKRYTVHTVCTVEDEKVKQQTLFNFQLSTFASRAQGARGMTLIELLIASAIFLMVSVALYQTYVGLFRTVSHSRSVLSASTLASELFEIVRTIPYKDVGVSGSIPNGVLPSTATYTRDGIAFTATTTVRNIDDPFDGLIGGAPNDLSPADYKLVQVEIDCAGCRTFTPLVFTTTVSPKNLETASTNGALFVRVYDASGQPVQGASVHIENNATTSPISINDVTNADGVLQIIDAPPAVTAYEITVSKSGYSTDRTYPEGAPGNPNPEKVHATVAIQQVTQITFTIDLLSSLTVDSVTSTCAAVGSLQFDLKGAKLIGVSPDVLKYDVAHVTDGSGRKSIDDLEWDTYTLAVTDTSYDLSGLIPFLPPTLLPDSHLNLKLVVEPVDAPALLVTVKDLGTHLPITGAEVELQGHDTRTTGQGFLRQTDWSGGAGQEFFTDMDRYHSDDGAIAVGTPEGTLTLAAPLGFHAPSGELVSSIFDTGSASNFYQIRWQPTTQPPETGVESVRFQVATAEEVTATTTWEFLGPDGTGSSYYTVADQNINTLHNGNQYFRYKAFLSTADAGYTPTVSEVAFAFTSLCVPPGQVLFGGVGLGTHTVVVSKTGYESYVSEPITLSGDFSSHEVALSPE